MCGSFPGLLIGRTAGKDPAFAAYDQFLSTGILQPLSQDEVRYGSWLCQNSSTRRRRRNILKELHIRESKILHTTMFDALMENCFYTSICAVVAFTVSRACAASDHATALN